MAGRLDAKRIVISTGTVHVADARASKRGSDHMPSPLLAGEKEEHLTWMACAVLVMIYGLDV